MKKVDWKALTTERHVEIPDLLKTVERFKPKTLLDVGFAGGWYHPDIVRMGVEYTGMDSDRPRAEGQTLLVSQYDKDLWKESLEMIELLHEDILEYPTDEHKLYDMVISVSTIEHIVAGGYAGYFKGDMYADIKAVLHMKELVAKGGTLYLTFPCGQEKFYYSEKNNNKEVLSVLQQFQLGHHDVVFYDKKRIDLLIDDWKVISLRGWIRDGEVWTEVGEEAFEYEHKDAYPKALCILHLER